ncbi:MAG TPA: VCBS repeat-containing protein [Thermoanaerobaculia bacterium]|nr:VCBS repeat-containing protein [Thermoanaerobaculia bacterium]
MPATRYALCQSFFVSLLLLGLLMPPPAQAATLALERSSFDLPGPPVMILPVDLNADGRLDLAVVVVATSWQEIGITETSKLDDVEGLVEVMTVVPALLDRRELRAFLREPSGYRALEPLELPPGVLTVEKGPPAEPLLALTDEGISTIKLDAEGKLQLEAIVADPPVIAGSGQLISGLGLAQDLDGDGTPDFLLPGRDGLAIYLAQGGALSRQPAARLSLPLDERLPGEAAHYRERLVRHYPLPLVMDFDGDRKPDLLVRNFQREWNQFQLLRSLGGGRFAKPQSPLGDRPREAKPRVVFVGDLDGDGRAELVTQTEPPEPEDDSLKKSLEAARRPKSTLEVHRLSPDLQMVPSPSTRFDIEGYAMAGDGDIRLPGGFQDLNGDGRLDLVAINLDFSLFEAVRVLAAKRIKLGLDFNLWCQQADGSFRPVKGLDLSGQFTLNFSSLHVGQLSLFAGDFDGDGRADFVQMGRGKRVTLHLGRADCSYPSAPDYSIDLAEPIADLSLVKVEDLNGDHRADLAIVQPGARSEDGTTSPVRLELYLSGGQR